MDKVTQDRIKLLHPKVRDEVSKIVNEANNLLTKHSQIRIVQGLRTIEEQNDLYAQGRTKQGKKVTNAKGGSSFHNYGLAVDFCLLIDDKETNQRELPQKRSTYFPFSIMGSRFSDSFHLFFQLYDFLQKKRFRSLSNINNLPSSLKSQIAFEKPLRIEKTMDNMISVISILCIYIFNL